MLNLLTLLCCNSSNTSQLLAAPRPTYHVTRDMCSSLLCLWMLWMLTSSTALSLITIHNAYTCLCRRMSLEDFRHVRRLIIRIILSTDMAAHHDSVDEFAASLRLWGPDLAAWAPDKRVVALQVGHTTNSLLACLLACGLAACVCGNNLRYRLAGCATYPGLFAAGAPLLSVSVVVLEKSQAASHLLSSPSDPCPEPSSALPAAAGACSRHLQPCPPAALLLPVGPFGA